MKKHVLLACFCCLFFAAKSQTCAPGNSCDEAPIVCGFFLNGFQGETPFPPNPQTFPPFDCGTIENFTWLGFSACASTVALEIQVFNCAGAPQGGGMQAMIFYSDDCEGFVPVSNCVGQIFPGTTAVISAGGLTPGDVYYLMLDGFAGDVCSYQINVLDGVEADLPVFNTNNVTPGHIDGPANVGCGTPPGYIGEYQVVPPTCEAVSGGGCPLPIDDCYHYTWTLLPGAQIISANADSSYVMINFSGASSGFLTVSLAWDESCDCHCGFCPAAVFPSTFSLFINVNQPSIVQLSLITSCQPVVFDLCGTPVQAIASGQFTCQSGCQAFVQNVVITAPSVDVLPEISYLLPGDSVELTTSGSPNLTYDWSGPGINASNQHLQSPAVGEPGIYSVTVTDAQGCTATASAFVFPGAACAQLNSPVAPADLCQLAPPFCESYLQGYCSNNVGFSADIPGNLAAAISCGIENNSWLTFTACNDSATFVFSVENCLSGGGLEFSVLQTVDCQNFTAIVNCQAIANDSSQTLTLTGLIPGDTYYIMVDGIGGDVCQWQVLSAGGLSDGLVLQEENTPGIITNQDGSPAPTQACQSAGSPVTLVLTFSGASCLLTPVGGGDNCPGVQQICWPHPDTCLSISYDTVWHVTPPGAQFVNGDSVGAEVEILFPDSLSIQPGGSVVFTISVEFVPQVTDTVLCFDSCLVACVTVLPDSEPCGILPHQFQLCAPQNTQEFHLVCPGEVVVVGGVPYTCGVYVVTSTDACGCLNSHTIAVECLDTPFPNFSGPDFLCDQNGEFYRVSFYASGDLFYTANGVPFDPLMSGYSYVSPSISSGQPYNFDIMAYGTCETFFFNFAGTHVCPCPNPPPPVSPGTVTETCDATGLTYRVAFDILGGSPPFFVNGNASGSFYLSNPIPTGSPYFFQITDSGVCGGSLATVQGIFDCPSALPFAGTMSAQAITLCDELMAAAEWHNDAILQPDDALVFILHTLPGTSLGTVLATNTTGVFGFDPGTMSYGQTYFISAVAGNELGGSVDLSDPNLSVAPGQPVVFYEKPALQLLESEMLTCVATSVMLISLPGGGSGNFSFEWAGPGSFSSVLQNPALSLPGNFSCVLTDNLTGCTATAAIEVQADTEPPDLSAAGDTLTCAEPLAVLQANSATPGVVFTWTFPGGDVMSGASISTNIPGDYLVSALAPNGCESEAQILVADETVLPDLYLTADSIICGQAATLQAFSNTPGVIFTWTLPNGETATGANISTTEPGDYLLSASAPNGCASEVQAEVPLATDTITSFFLVKSPTCFGDKDGFIQIDSVAGGTAPYLLLPGMLENLGAGEFQVTVTDANGCASATNILLEQPPQVTVELGDDHSIQMGESVELSFEANIVPAEIHWTGPAGQTWDGVSSFVLQPKTSGTYALVIADANGCTASDEVKIVVKNATFVFIPNAFSPNDDGKNDRLLVFAGEEVAQVRNFSIFDRWGEKVFFDENFTPNDPLRGWDGRRKGKPLDPAVFVFMVEVEFQNGETKVLAGDVALLR